MKKQARFKGLTKKEVEYLKRRDRRDLIELLLSIGVFGAVLIFVLVAVIGAMK